MTNHTAIVLFAHGARDARWAQPLETLRDSIQRARPQSRIAIAFLELQEPRLPETLAALAAEGVRHVDIAPIFWARGGHIARDLPALVAAFHDESPQVSVRLLPVLSELAGMDAFVAGAIAAQVAAGGPAAGTP
jgi:sirohydrochlorin cobaltochelatase